jgi:hypothetical protein
MRLLPQRSLVYMRTLPSEHPDPIAQHPAALDPPTANATSTMPSSVGSPTSSAISALAFPLSDASTSSPSATPTSTSRSVAVDLSWPSPASRPQYVASSGPVDHQVQEPDQRGYATLNWQLPHRSLPSVSVRYDRHCARNGVGAPANLTTDTPMTTELRGVTPVDCNYRSRSITIRSCRRQLTAMS